MAYRISNIQLPVEAPETDVADHVATRLGVPVDSITGWRILRKSLDARSRRDLKFVYSVVADLADDAAPAKYKTDDKQVDQYSPQVFDDAQPGTNELAERPVIVGSGPAGLLAGYYLAAKGYRPLIIERGQAVKERVPAIREFDRGGAFDRENNYLFGEGGAGTFSDGKLTCRMSGPDVDWVLQRLADFGGKASIAYENRPHLGSNRLPLLVRNCRRQIEALGGEYRFGCRFEGLSVIDGRVTNLHTSSGTIRASVVVLAIGHSARDTYRMLYDMGIPMESKPFQLGLRIEQPQENVNRFQYGRPEYLKILGAADYSLVSRGPKDLFTFCMCAGGIIIPSISEPEMFCTNGMSNSRHDTPFANSGLVVTLNPDELESSHPLAGVELQRKFEAVAYQLGRRDYLCPIQTADDFLSKKPADAAATLECSYQRGTVAADLSEVLPPIIAKTIRHGLPIMDKKWGSRFLEDAVLVGPEMRGSSPVRILRDRQTYQTPGIAGLYPVGEGAGYAGGIISAAVDGLRAAKAVVRQFTPLEQSAVS